MSRACSRALRRRALTALAGLAALSPAAAARAQFVEDDVVVLHAIEGATPEEQLGWAVSELPDVDGDSGRAYLISPARRSR